MNAALPERIRTVRRFNRFYTRRIGVLEDGLLHTPYSLTEARVIYELAQVEQTTATRLGETLGLDAGYLSRILRSFQERGLLKKKPSGSDGRQTLLSLSARGRAAFATLDEASQSQVGALLHDLSEAAQQRVLDAMRVIEHALDGQGARASSYVLREPQAGDFGWIVQSHGSVYAEEYDWNVEFEGFAAEIVGRFVKRFDAARERCWIVELDGENVGTVMLVKKSMTVGQLRLLLVDPKARGLGIGRRLVDECIAFGRAAGYRRIMLWTNANLHAARRIYERAGFRLIDEQPHHSFGHDLLGQTWELVL